MDFQYLKLTAKACLRYLKHRSIPKAEGKRCIIAGNGPSLKKNLKENLSTLQSEPVFCVNHFANSPEFSIIKPTYYFMLDPNLSSARVSEAREQARNNTFKRINELNWEMHIFFPCIPGQILLEKELYSPYVQLHMCNIFPGFTLPGVRNAVYRTGLFMPPPQNVLVASIFEAINMGYTEIYVLGAEHSWLEDLRVKDDNLLYTVHKHFSGQTKEVPMYKVAPHNTKTFKVHEILEAFRRTFRSYWLLREYAESRGVKIYNSTPGSFIDAFDRKDISTLYD